MALTIHRALVLPETPAARHKNCIYLIKPEGATVVDIYVVDGQGNAYANFNEERFAALFELYSKSLQLFSIVANIADRDSLDLKQSALVFVIDATDDPSVASGSAMYFYTKHNDSYLKIFKSEGVDWNFISGRPLSSSEEIDLAVQASHTHENKGTLDLLNAVGDSLYYNGQPVTRYLVGKADW